MFGTSGFSWNAEMDETTVLFRPVGQKELELIRQSAFTEFPTRLPEQPIFYPVLSEEYATQIARDWNAKRNDSKVGYVTRFYVRTDISSNTKSKLLVAKYTKNIGYQLKIGPV